MTSQVQDTFHGVVPQTYAFDCNFGNTQFNHVSGYYYPPDVAQWMQTAPLDTYPIPPDYPAADFPSQAGGYYGNISNDAYYQHCMPNISANLTAQLWELSNCNSDYLQSTAYNWLNTQ